MGRLDVLVNNAGVGTDFGVSGTAPDFDAVQRALDTNFFGAYRLTVALLGLLRESPHPRIVNVSSGMGGVAEMGGWSPGYRVSKAAHERDDAHPVDRAEGRGHPGQLRVSGLREHRHGRADGRDRSRSRTAPAGIVWLATLPDDGPTGGFFRDGEPVAF